MRSLFLILLALSVSFFFPYPLEGKSSQETNVGSTRKLGLEKVKAILNLLKEVLFEKFDKDAFTEGMIHFAKAFGDKEILETWYKLPEDERKCIIKSKEAIHWKILSGEICVTPDEAVKIIQTDCPNSSDQLQKIYERKLARMQECMKEIKAHLAKLPESVRLVFEMLFTALRNLKQDCNFRSREKVFAELLPVLEQRLKIPQADLEKFAELCPDLAPVLTGDLKKYVEMNIRALIKYFKTGKFCFLQHVDFMRFFTKLTPFWRERVQKLSQLIADKEEQGFEDFVVQGIEKEVPECVDKMEKFLEECVESRD